MTLIDYLPTRTFELTVHSLDLARALGIESLAVLGPAVSACCELAGRLAGSCRMRRGCSWLSPGEAANRGVSASSEQAGYAGFIGPTYEADAHGTSCTPWCATVRSLEAGYRARCYPPAPKPC
jgi:hypothetical protein